MTKRALNAHLWERDPDDFYCEPSWVSERLFQVEPFIGRVWDPACGSGRIVLAARVAGYDATGTDKIRRGAICSDTADFLGPVITAGENIVSNPPFKDARRFAELALQRATYKVALLLPTKWLHGDARARWLSGLPLYRVWFLTPRPSMPPGRVIEAGVKPGGGKEDFAWLVFLKGYDGRPELRWLHREG